MYTAKHPADQKAIHVHQALSDDINCKASQGTVLHIDASRSS